ncbi:unnamed protein product [Symbiodinium sp. CCMP2592]|nr:unnamed protein product [Symbiodinium sp. CCMP2592]
MSLPLGRKLTIFFWTFCFEHCSLSGSLYTASSPSGDQGFRTQLAPAPATQAHSGAHPPTKLVEWCARSSCGAGSCSGRASHSSFQEHTSGPSAATARLRSNASAVALQLWPDVQGYSHFLSGMRQDVGSEPVYSGCYAVFTKEPEAATVAEATVTSRPWTWWMAAIYPKTTRMGKDAPPQEPANAQQLLNLLPTAPQGSSPALPSQALLETHMASNHKIEARAMHKLVHQQGQAKVELSNVRKSRAQFLQEWHLYLQKLTDLLTQQVQKKNASMQAYAEAEDKWEQQLQAASKAMQVASGAPINVASDDEEQLEAQETEVMQDVSEDAARQTAAEAATERENALMAALASTTEAAHTQAQEYRERTPRRTKGGQGAHGFSALSSQQSQPKQDASREPMETAKETPPGKAQ